MKLDEDIITAEYHEQFNVTPHFVAHQEQTKLDDMVFRRQRFKMQLALFLSIAILAVAGFYFWKWYEGKQKLSLSPVGENGVTNSVETSPPPVTDSAPENVAFPDETDQSGDQNGGEDLATADPEPSLPLSGNPEDVEEEGSSLPSESDTGNPEGAPGEDASGEDAPVQGLPLSDLSNVVWTPEDNPALEMTEMFAIQSLDAVWVEVVIDGQALTNRILNKGQVRYYRYGDVNTLVIGDTSKVAIQDGSTFRAQLDQRNLSPKLRDFKSGELLNSYEAWLSEHGPAERQPEQ